MILLSDDGSKISCLARKGSLLEEESAKERTHAPEQWRNSFMAGGIVVAEVLCGRKLQCGKRGKGTNMGTLIVMVELMAIGTLEELTWLSYLLVNNM